MSSSGGQETEQHEVRTDLYVAKMEKLNDSHGQMRRLSLPLPLRCHVTRELQTRNPPNAVQLVSSVTQFETVFSNGCNLANRPHFLDQLSVLCDICFEF